MKDLKNSDLWLKPIIYSARSILFQIQITLTLNIGDWFYNR